MYVGKKDYAAARRYTAKFPSGMTVASFDVKIFDDKIFERSENFSLVIISKTLPKDVSIGNIGRTVVTITDFGKSLNHCK